MILLGSFLLLFSYSGVYVLLRKRHGQSIPDALIVSWLILLLFMFVLSELLSLSGIYKPPYITLAWVIGAGILGFVLRSSFLQVGKLLKDDFGTLSSAVGYLNKSFCCFWVVAAVLVLTLLHGILAPSSNADALSYHLPRAVQWLKNGSICFYETAVFRQNFQAPLFSIVVAHLLALSNSDVFLNTIQWYSLVINGIVLYQIAWELNLSKRGQAFALCLSFTVPCAAGQAVECTNDLFACTAVMVFVLYLIRLLKESRVSGWNCVFCGLSMGVSFVAKFSSLVHVAGLAVPISLVFIVKALLCGDYLVLTKKVLALAAVVVLGCLLLVPQISRNYRAYHDPFSGEPKHLMTCTNMSPQKLSVNYIKHVSMHLGTPSYSINRCIEKPVRWLCGEMINSPDISYVNPRCFTDYRIFTTFGKLTAVVGNPLHIIFYTVILFLSIFMKWPGKIIFFVYTFFPLLFATLLYSLVFKWQPWCPRLHLPYFMMIALGIACFVSEMKSEIGRISSCCFSGYALLYILSWPTWFVPSFLFGDNPKDVSYGKSSVLMDNIAYLNTELWSSDARNYLNTNGVPEVLSSGYSVFFSPRDLLVLGNTYYGQLKPLYADIKKLVPMVESFEQQNSISQNIGLLISSVHGNLPCDEGYVDKRLSSECEYPLWKAFGNINGQGHLKLFHFGQSEPTEIALHNFGNKAGVIISDGSRSSVLSSLNRLYKIDKIYSGPSLDLYIVFPRAE